MPISLERQRQEELENVRIGAFLLVKELERGDYPCDIEARAAWIARHAAEYNKVDKKIRAAVNRRVQVGTVAV